MQQIRKIISTNYSKTAIPENLDPRKLSAIRYTGYGNWLYIHTQDNKGSNLHLTYMLAVGSCIESIQI